jgi:predicted ATP-dependent endonuclease of OLD family
MRLLQVQVKNFKSIENSGPVTIDAEVTVLVGQNEAGKTAFLQALEKARPIRKGIKFEPTEDYPRRSLNEYLRQHEANPADAVILTYELDSWRSSLSMKRWVPRCLNPLSLR